MLSQLPGKARICWMHDFWLPGAGEAAARGTRCPQLPFPREDEHRASSPPAPGPEWCCGCNARGIPQHTGGTQGKLQGGTFPSGPHLYARCWVAAHTFGPYLSPAWKTLSNKIQKHWEQHFNMEAWRLPEIGTRETALNKSSDSMQEQNQSWPFSCPQIIEKFPCAESGAL